MENSIFRWPPDLHHPPDLVDLDSLSLESSMEGVNEQVGN